MSSSAVRRKYNWLAKIYDIIYANYVRKTVRYAAQAVPLHGYEKILDIGCGTGPLEKRLLEKAPQLTIVGIDISADMLERAQKKLAPFPNISLKEGDFLKMDLPDNHFDIVFSLSNFHYFRNPLPLLKKIGQSLKPGGLFILIDWNRDSFQGKLYNYYMRSLDSAFAKVYTPKEVTDLLEKTGFTTQKIDLFCVDLRWRMMRLIAKKA